MFTVNKLKFMVIDAVAHLFSSISNALYIVYHIEFEYYYKYIK